MLLGEILLPGAGEHGPGSGLWLGLEEVFVFDSKSENRDRAVEAVGAVSEASLKKMRNGQPELAQRLGEAEQALRAKDGDNWRLSLEDDPGPIRVRLRDTAT